MKIDILTRSPVLCLLAVGFLPNLAGCNHQNYRNDLGNRVVLPALAAEAMADEPPQSDASSLSSLDRRHWATTTIEVPIHGIAHGPTYATKHRSTSATARQRGEPLTALNALELTGDTAWTDAGDVAEAPLYCIWDALMIVPRAMVTRPWTEIRGDQEAYWRSSVWDARIAPIARPLPLPAPTADSKNDDEANAPAAEPAQ